MKADCLSYVIAIKRVSFNGSQKFTSMLCNTFARSTALDPSHMSECKVGYSLSLFLSLIEPVTTVYYCVWHARTVHIWPHTFCKPHVIRVKLL